MNLRTAITMVCDFADNKLNGCEERVVVRMQAAIEKVRAVAELKAAGGGRDRLRKTNEHEKQTESL